MVKFMSRLPMRALYGFAWLLYVLAYYVVRHRHQVIRMQIAQVFPDLGEAERVAIHKQFLRNFCDVLVEVLKSASMSAAQISAHVRILNLPAARAPLDDGRSIMLVTSHLCNWEWLLHTITVRLGFPLDAAYKPLHDQWAERLMLDIRSRFGARLVPAKDLLTDFLTRRGIVRAIAMNADQAPISTDKRYWTLFLGQDTAFYMGAEQIARATRLPMFYVVMRRVGRGLYEVEFEPLWDGRETVPPNGITERYARACERDVLRSPPDWLWSYRRWRLKKPLYGAD